MIGIGWVNQYRDFGFFRRRPKNVASHCAPISLASVIDRGRQEGGWQSRQPGPGRGVSHKAIILQIVFRNKYFRCL